MKITVENYTKVIKNNTVLSNINLEFESGRVYGLSGRNGCGKTMLLRAICGLILPTEGRVVIDGKTIGKDIEFPPRVGIIIENMTLPGEYTAFDNLKILAKINKRASDEDIRNALSEVGLDPDSKKRVRAFSLGMRQKLTIAQAIMERPDLLLLDEPTNSLDEKSVNDFKDLILRQKKFGTLVIIASHNREDLNDICDEIIEMSDGEVKNILP